jgi:hypothetical protein
LTLTVFLMSGRISFDGEKYTLFYGHSEARDAVDIIKIDFSIGNSGMTDNSPDIPAIFVTSDSLDNDRGLLGDSNDELLHTTRRVEVDTHGLVVVLQTRVIKTDGAREGSIFVYLR